MSPVLRGVTGFLLWGALATAAGLAQAPVSAANAANAPEISTHDEPATFRTGVVKNTAGLTLQARRGYYARQHAADPAETAKGNYVTSEVSQLFHYTTTCQDESWHGGHECPRHMVAHSCRRAAVSKSPGLFTSSEKTVARPGAGASSASGITLKSNFDLMPGIYSIRLVVRDTEGQMMTARNGAVRIP